MPFMYHLTGSSLKMDSFRKIIQQGVSAIQAEGLTPKVVAFDGQFLEASVKDFDGNPVTLCKLDKMVWEKAKSTPKEKQVSFFGSLNYTGPVNSLADLQDKCDIAATDGKVLVSQKSYIQVYTPQDMPTMEQEREVNIESSESEHSNDELIMRYLPDDIIESLDEESLKALRLASSNLAAKSQAPDPEREDSDAITNDDTSIEPKEGILCGLIASSSSVLRVEKWNRVSLQQFMDMLAEGKTIEQNFTVSELQMILYLSNGGKKVTGRKAYLVNCVSKLFGDGTVLPSNTKVQPLRTLVLGKLRKIPKTYTNILYATNIWQQEKSEYERRARFPSNKPYTIATTDSTFTIHQWYAQPITVCQTPVQFVIDPHHILVNNRCRCCSNGMYGMSIDPHAWTRVAEGENLRTASEKTGLSLELTTELRDRQRNAFAMTTFSEKVENVMRENGDMNEAKWCKLIREWYSAVDEAGISVSQRIHWMLEMRKHLLQFYHPGKFPPPGAYMAGLPMAQFEGIMCNVDRRLQLYALANDGTYNHRSVSSLDSETMFGAFQVS